MQAKRHLIGGWLVCSLLGASGQPGTLEAVIVRLGVDPGGLGAMAADTVGASAELRDPQGVGVAFRHARGDDSAIQVVYKPAGSDWRTRTIRPNDSSTPRSFNRVGAYLVLETESADDGGQLYVMNGSLDVSRVLDGRLVRPVADSAFVFQRLLRPSVTVAELARFDPGTGAEVRLYPPIDDPRRRSFIETVGPQFQSGAERPDAMSPWGPSWFGISYDQVVYHKETDTLRFRVTLSARRGGFGLATGVSERLVVNCQNVSRSPDPCGQ